MMTSTTSPLTADEKTWIEDQSRAAIQFVASFSPSDSNEQLTLNALDRAFSNWLASNPAPETINGVIDIVGIAFGESLVRQCEFDWAIVSDEWGCDLAILALPAQGDVTVFPRNFVAKRWESGEANFLERAFADIRASVQSIREGSKKANPS